MLKAKMEQPKLKYSNYTLQLKLAQRVPRSLINIAYRSLPTSIRPAEVR